MAEEESDANSEFSTSIQNEDSPMEERNQKRGFSFFRRLSKRRSNTTTNGEQLGIKQLLHLCEDNDCHKIHQPEGTREASDPNANTPSSPLSKTGDGPVAGQGAGRFFYAKKQAAVPGVQLDRPKRQSSEKTNPKSVGPENIEFRKANSLDFKLGDSNGLEKMVGPPAKKEPSTTAATAEKSAINATMRSQSMNQADHQNQQQSTSKQRQPNQFPYPGMPLFPHLTSPDSRRLPQTTTTAAAAGFFGLISPTPALLSTATIASTTAGWQKRRGNASTNGSRAFANFDYALAAAGIDPTLASSSNCLLSAAGQNHFVVEFCDDLFSRENSSNTGATSEIDATMKSPKRKISAATPTPRTSTTTKASTGDSICENGQQQRANNEPSTPPSSPADGQVTAEDDSPKRRQQQERVDVVLALRGVSLREAVQGIVEKRQLNMERVNLFLESSNTPVPWETDTSFLGGQKLYAKAKKDDSPFSKNPLFLAAGGQSGAIGTATNANQQTATVPSSQQKSNDPAATSAHPAGNHLFPMSPVFTAGLISRRESTTANPGLSKTDRKLSLTQLTKKRAPDRLSLTPDSSFALNLSSATTVNSGSTNTDGMPAEKFCSPAMPASADGGFMFNGSSTVLDAVPSSSSTPQHYHNGSLSAGSFSVAGRKERSRSQGRLSQIFPNPFKQDDRLEMLERLTHFQEHGLMTAAALLHDVNIIFCQSALHLEERWQDITNDHESLTRKQQEQQEGLWELVTTELNYIKKLGCIVELQACVHTLQEEGFLHDVDIDAVFGNITEICRANLRFWLQCLYPLLQYSRKTGESLDPTKLEAGFEHIDRLFSPYIQYCLNHVDMLCYIRRKQKESELFKEFVLWVKTRRVFGRLDLTDLLAKPMQRLTKYPLLLKAVLKSTTDGPGRQALNSVIEKTEEFASRVNIELHHKQHYDNLCNIMQCIESYDAIETTNDELDRLVKEYSYVDLTAPMLGCRPKLLRQLVLKGDMKLKEAYAKMDVVCYLFTDMFLVCKSFGKKGDRVRVKIARPPYHLDRVVVRQLRETAGFAFVYLNEFNIPAAAATFLTPNQDEACKWLDHFHLAKDDYQRMKMTDEVTVYKQVARRSFDVSSLSNSSSEHHVSANSADSGNSVRRLSAHLTAPVLSAKDFGPQRRISMTAMDDKKQRKPIPAIDVNHRKCSSMDNSVVTSAIAAAYRYSPLHCSVDGLRNDVPTATITISDMAKSSSEDDPNLNLPIPEVSENEGGGEQEGVMRRLRANSVEMLKRLSPRLRAPSSVDRSPSPRRPSSRGASPAVFSFRAPTLPESHSASTLAPLHSTTSTLNAVFSTPPTTPLPNAVEAERRLSGSHSPLLPQRSASPFRKQRIPSPVFFKSDKQLPSGCSSPNPAAVDSVSGGSRCASPFSSLFRTSANNSLESDELPVVSSPSVTPVPTQMNGHHPTNRRLERRYHTADGIEELKPRRAPQGGILKRFSWSTPAAAAAAAAAAASGTSAHQSSAPKADTILRKASATTVSSESFGSSSGVSSSSSQLYVSQSETELPVGESPSECVQKSMTSLSGRRFLKWSTAPRITHQETTDMADQAINESPTRNPDRHAHHHHRNVSTIVIGEAAATLEAGEEEIATVDVNSPTQAPQGEPGSGQCLSAKDSLRRKGIPIIETQAPTPLATPVTTHPTHGTFTGAAVPQSRPIGNLRDEFLRQLLAGNLESSDV